MSATESSVRAPSDPKRSLVRASVLLIEDEELVRELFRTTLLRAGHMVECATTLAELREKIHARAFDVMVMDLKLPDGRSDAVIEEVLRRDPATQIIIVTGDYSVETAVSVMRKGACDYLLKPMRPDRLLLAVEEASEKWLRHTEAEARSRNPMDRIRSRHRLIGSSARVCRVNILLQEAAQIDVPVLLTGEEGTGKSLAARAIHELSNRRDRPYVRISSNQFPRPLVEKELFGEENESGLLRKGMLEMAEGGTVYLDEVHGFPAAVQEQLKELISNGTIKRVGTMTPRALNVRIIASTSRDLQQLMDDEEVGLEFLTKLRGSHIKLPALRKHIEDISELAEHFLREKSLELGKNVVGFDSEVIEFFQHYDWPGNVRELSNMVERLLILSRGDVVQVDRELFARFCLSEYQQADGGTDGDSSDGAADLPTLREVTARYLRRLMRRVKNNFHEAARVAGMDPDDFQFLLDEFNTPPPSADSE